MNHPTNIFERKKERKKGEGWKGGKKSMKEKLVWRRIGGRPLEKSRIIR